VAYSKANVEGILRNIFYNYLSYSDNVSAYRASLAAWELVNSERGLHYWKVLRGIDFEHAVAQLFRRRGCDVTTTKGSGDGGVDLVLNVGGKAFWCQCKGHAKPVSVAPIREIAGVCSRGQAGPVIFAVNGFTKPAIATADELGVACLDAPDLCNLARLEEITSVGEVVRGSPLR
jgi:HJR/Mrr/RecB family endonuclease